MEGKTALGASSPAKPALHWPSEVSPLANVYLPDPSFRSATYSPSYLPPVGLLKYLPLPSRNPATQSPSYLSPFCHFITPYPPAALSFQPPSYINLAASSSPRYSNVPCPS